MPNTATTTNTKPDEGSLVTKREREGEGETRDSFSLGNMKEMDNNQETRRNILRETE
jgi:hypothetical protein